MEMSNQYKPARFNKVETALIYLYLLERPVKNMVLTADDTVAEMNSEKLRVYALPMERSAKVLERELNIPESQLGKTCLAELQTFMERIPKDYPKPYMIEFNVPTPFIDSSNVRVA